MACFIMRAKTHPLVNRINSFLTTPRYIIAVMFLTGLANLFHMELPVYTVFSAIVIFTCCFGNDLLPLMPLFVGGYLAPSGMNNPGRNETSVFSGASGIYIVCLACVIVLSLVFRLIRDRHRFRERKPKLLSGMLILSAGYLLSGIGSAAYPEGIGNNLFFAFLQCASLLVPYLLFCYGVDWQNVRRDYFAWVGFSTGCLLVAEILGIYLQHPVIVNGIIQRKEIFTGWGMHNNLGVMLAISIPFAFCLATKYRRGWIGTVAGSAFLVCLFLTCSRSSIFTGCAFYGICVLLVLHYAHNRKHNTIALVAVSVVILLIILLFQNPLLRLFSDLLRIGLDPSHRDEIFSEGLKLFLQNPVFGNSFFSPGYEPWGWATSDAFNAFFPPRWHNTIVQILASCGLAGLGAYIFHRIQTVRLLLSHRTKENTFIACSLLTLLICSMFDCHFFNVGPVLFYSMALAFMENRPDGQIKEV